MSQDLAARTYTSAAHSTMTTLFRSAATWTALGLIGGLAYREITKFSGFTGSTQLSIVHTHTLALGMTVMLVLLGMVAVLPALAERMAFRRGILVYQLGLALSTVMMFVKGVLQVQGSTIAGSPAISGMSGLGHIIITVGIVMLFVGLNRVVHNAGAGSDRAAAAV